MNNGIIVDTKIVESYECDDFLIYRKEYTPMGPWLDNGSITSEYYYKDDTGEKLLEEDECLILDDGGTMIYVFKNGDKLVLPHEDPYEPCNEILRYNNTPLKKNLL